MIKNSLRLEYYIGKIWYLNLYHIYKNVSAYNNNNNNKEKKTNLSMFFGLESDKTNTIVKSKSRSTYNTDA